MVNTPHSLILQRNLLRTFNCRTLIFKLTYFYCYVSLDTVGFLLYHQDFKLPFAVFLCWIHQFLGSNFVQISKAGNMVFINYFN